MTVANRSSADQFDVILLSDFRFPGGTSHSNAEEIRAQAALGYSTGLVQVTSPVLRKDHPVNPVIQRCVDAGLARFVAPGARSRCRLLVVRHPTVLQHSRKEMPAVEAERVVVIVNQAPVDAKKGRDCYDMREVQANARRFFGEVGTWYPIGPLVRVAIQGERGMRNLAADDWHNIIDVADWRVERISWASDRPVIGRHSRDSVDKWSHDPGEILLAYPDDDEFRVRILGGAEFAQRVLGRLPERWEVSAFGTVSPRDFLAGIDFFVYYHHRHLVESFGRTILEAMASGAPAILPPHFAQLFEDAAIYAEPADVRGIVRNLHADRAAYEERSRKGFELVESRFSHAAHAQRLAALMQPDSQAPSERNRRLWSMLSRLRARPVRLTADLEPESVYRLRIDLEGVSAGTRGTVRGSSRATGEQLFAIEIDGATQRVSTLVITREHPEQVDVALELAGNGPGKASLRRMRAERRADRPRQPPLDLGETSVTAALATYPGRRQVVPDVIDSLVTQVDRLFVYLNNYEEVPSFISRHPQRERIVFILDPASQRRAAAKFHWLSSVRGFHLLCDDDILYPPDYAARMVEAVEQRERRAIVGVHGVRFQPVVDDARTSRHAVFKFPEPLESATPVHFLGTGTVALHADVLASMDLSRFHAHPIANDEILAVSARKAGVPMICIARPASWLEPHPGARFGIFEERSIDRAEHDAATRLLASANPWPPLE